MTRMARKKIEKPLIDELMNINKINSESQEQPDKEFININFKLDEGATLPSYAHDGDAGMDVYATDLQYDVKTDTYIYHTGVAYESGKGICSLGLARSSNSKTSAYLTNGVGLIDCEIYRGYVQFRYKNRTSLSMRVSERVFTEMLFIPWWKKIFLNRKKLKELYKETYNYYYDYYLSRALDYAPYKVGEKIGQIMFVKYLTANSKVVDELSETERGVNGFGSTDKPKE